MLLRGLPGSGKSPLDARMFAPYQFLHVEVDQHFVTNGVSRFDQARAADAHAAMTRDTLTALQAGRRVEAANIHVRFWEMAAAVGTAQLAGRSVGSVECGGRWTNVHSHAETVLTAMGERCDRLPREFEGVSFQFKVALRCPCSSFAPTL